MQAILGGVAGFWGGVFGMGSVYLLMVAAKKIINPVADEGNIHYFWSYFICSCQKPTF